MDIEDRASQGFDLRDTKDVRSKDDLAEAASTIKNADKAFYGDGFLASFGGALLGDEDQRRGSLLSIQGSPSREGGRRSPVRKTFQASPSGSPDTSNYKDIRGYMRRANYDDANSDAESVPEGNLASSRLGREPSRRTSPGRSPPRHDRDRRHRARTPPENMSAMRKFRNDKKTLQCLLTTKADTFKFGKVEAAAALETLMTSLRSNKEVESMDVQTIVRDGKSAHQGLIHEAALIGQLRFGSDLSEQRVYCVVEDESAERFVFCFCVGQRPSPMIPDETWELGPKWLRIIGCRAS